MRDLCTDMKYRTSWKLQAAADMCMTGGPDPTLVDYGATFPFPWTWHTVNVPAEKQRQRGVPRAVPRHAPPKSDDYTREYDVKRVKLVPVTKWWTPEEEKTPEPTEIETKPESTDEAIAERRRQLAIQEQDRLKQERAGPVYAHQSDQRRGWTWDATRSLAERPHDSGYSQYVHYFPPLYSWGWGWDWDGQRKWGRVGHPTALDAMVDAERRHDQYGSLLSKNDSEMTQK